MGTGPLAKNGHDKLQDRAIQDLHDDFRDHIAEEETHHVKVERVIDQLIARMDKYLFGARIAWGFLAILGTIVLIYQASLDRRLDYAEERLDLLTAKQHAFEERGTKWGQSLDLSVSDIRQDIREIRRLINGRGKD